MNHKKNRIFIALFFLFFVTGSSFAEITTVDAGIITSTKGRAFYSNINEKNGFSEISVLMKVRSGDTLKIDKDSELAILYQANGRREVWKGPVMLKITELRAIPEDGENKSTEPAVSSIPIEISDSIAMVSLPQSQTSKKRAGIRVVRGSEPQVIDSNTSGEQVYESLKKDLGSSDATPDLYLYSYYKSMGLEKETKSQADAIIKKWGKSPESISISTK